MRIITVSSIIFFIPLLLLILLSTGCYKIDDQDSGRDFIQLSIDEEENVYRIELEMTTAADIYAEYSEIPELPAYQFTMTFKGILDQQESEARLVLKSSMPFSSGPYVLSNTTEGLLYFPSFRFSPSPYETYSINNASSGTISLTGFEGTEPGQKVEGTFNFSRVQLRDQQNNIISSEHTILQGRFRATIK